MSDRIPLPKYLLQNSNAILTSLHIEKPAYIDIQKWLDSSADSTDISADLTSILNCYTDPNDTNIAQLTRSNLTNLASKAATGTWPDVRIFYLAVMMWGWSFNQLRGCEYVKKGYGYSKFKAILDDTVDLVSKNEIFKAYETFNLPGCRSAYFTKLFYFIGRAVHLKTQPVILDTNVIKCFHVIDTLENTNLVATFADAVIYQGKRKLKASLKEYPEGYMHYIYAMHDWANALNCEPDSIECFLFNKRDNDLSVTTRSPSKEMLLAKGDNIMTKNEVAITISLPAKQFQQLKKIAGSLGADPSNIASQYIERCLSEVYSDSISSPIQSDNMQNKDSNSDTNPLSQTIYSPIQIPVTIVYPNNKIGYVYNGGPIKPRTEIRINTSEADKIPLFDELRKFKKRGLIDIKLEICGVLYDANFRFYGDQDRHAYICAPIKLNVKELKLTDPVHDCGFARGQDVNVIYDGTKFALVHAA